MRWTVLAFVPSSLLLAVTSYMSTDVASVPLLWMVPLCVYLGTFIVAFSPSASRARALASRFMPLAVIALALLLIAQMNQPVSLVIPLHLLVFGVIALACHGELADDRPSPARLTEFYFWISLGGMLGGLFNAAARAGDLHRHRRVPARADRGVPGAARACPAADDARRGARMRRGSRVVGGAAMLSVLVNGQFGSASRFLILGAAVPALLAFSQQRRPLRFAGCVAALLLSGALVQSPFGRAVYADRTFFGVYRVRVDDRLNYRFMFHGPTLHGMQST